MAATKLVKAATKLVKNIKNVQNFSYQNDQK